MCIFIKNKHITFVKSENEKESKMKNKKNCLNPVFPGTTGYTVLDTGEAGGGLLYVRGRKG